MHSLDDLSLEDEPAVESGTARPETARSWSPVVAIALGAFALVVTEFLPVGVLPQLSGSLSVSEGTAGLTVTATAILGAVAAPAATLLIRRLDRRVVLLALTGLLIVSSVLSAVATSFAVLIVARVVLGVAVGAFWAIALAAATRLAPPGRSHTASALVLGGISVGSVLSVPAGSLIAAHADWHLTFVASSALAVVVFVVQAFVLPRMPAAEAVGIGHFFGLLREPKVLAILATVVFVVGGHYVAYTFITPYLQGVTGVGAVAVSALLLGYGAFTVVGNFVGGALAGRRLRSTVLGTTVVFAIALIAFAFAGGNFVVAIAALLLWSMAWGAAPVSTQLWLFAASDDLGHPIEAAQAMNTSVFQLSIGLGSLVGAIVVNGAGLTGSIWVGAAILLLAVASAAAFIRFDRRGTRQKGA